MYVISVDIHTQVSKNVTFFSFGNNESKRANTGFLPEHGILSTKRKATLILDILRTLHCAIHIRLFHEKTFIACSSFFFLPKTRARLEDRLLLRKVASANWNAPKTLFFRRGRKKRRKKRAPPPPFVRVSCSQYPVRKRHREKGSMWGWQTLWAKKRSIAFSWIESMSVYRHWIESFLKLYIEKNLLFLFDWIIYSFLP